MKRFVQLFGELDGSTATSRKVAAMARYFREAPAEDATWGLFFLMGRRQKRVLSVRALAGELLTRTALPSFLIDECYAAVGDLGEVLALLLAGDDSARDERPLHQIAVVMMYAHPGHGRRSNRYTDYTFGVFKDGALVPIARAYSGLTDAEIETLDRWIRAHTLERFGPTRVVEPVQVFTLHFEGIARSSRHKTGLALRFPRIARWRDDKRASEAGTYQELQRLLEQVKGPRGAVRCEALCAAVTFP